MTKEPIDVSLIFENLNPTFWKKGRLQTFQHWPFRSDKHRCNPDNMATAGFFAIGGKDEPDLAECFLCSKQLDGWESNDDPWLEHKKHQPNCPFIQMNKTDEGSLTLKELYQLLQYYFLHKKSLEFEKQLEAMKMVWKESARTIPHIYKQNQKSID